ncbi:terpene synthase metal-binding domain-containing protein [Ilyonectria destructans]|nr:terpene synthase metal-binding domain-containing protein [Ilyonectria destructans]
MSHLCQNRKRLARIQSELLANMIPAHHADLDAELAALRIPTFKFLWPEAYRERVVRTRYAWLAARCYPNASLELLQAIADYTVSTTTLPNLTAMIDVLDFDAASPEPIYGELAWLDVCRRLRRLLGHAPFERFATGMRLWATTAGLQIINHLQEEPCGMRQYEAIRRHTSGMNPCTALSDGANVGSVTSEEFCRPEVQTFCRIANNVVCWSNDIQSLGVEARQPGQFWNMVIIHSSKGHSLQESVDWTAARVRNEIAEFVKISDEIMPQAGEQLQGFIEGLRFWMRGYQDWVERDTERYAAVYAAEDADDRGVRL